MSGQQTPPKQAHPFDFSQVCPLSLLDVATGLYVIWVGVGAAGTDTIRGLERRFGGPFFIMS